MNAFLRITDVSLWQTEDYDFVAAKDEGHYFTIPKGGGRLVSEYPDVEHNRTFREG